eukprot:1159140-Pelagomonas_calceolata.AAC.6
MIAAKRKGAICRRHALDMKAPGEATLDHQAHWTTDSAHWTMKAPGEATQDHQAHWTTDSAHWTMKAPGEATQDH